MATVSFYFDKRRMRPDGSLPIRLSVQFCGKTILVATDVSVKSDQWHPTLSRVVNHPRRKELNNFVGEPPSCIQQKTLAFSFCQS